MSPEQHGANSNHDGAVQHRNQAVGFEQVKSGKIRTQVEDEGDEYLVKCKCNQHFHHIGVIPDDDSDGKGDDAVNDSKNDPQHYNARKMFAEQVIVLGNILVVKVRDAAVKKDIQ